MPFFFKVKEIKFLFTCNQKMYVNDKTKRRNALTKIIH